MHIPFRPYTRILTFVFTCLLGASSSWAQDGEAPTLQEIPIQIEGLYAGQIGPWTLGATFDAAGLAVAETAADSEGVVTWRLDGAFVMCDEVAFLEVQFGVADTGQLSWFRLRAYTNGEAFVDHHLTFLRRMCEPFGGLEERSPSPLGTPDPSDEMAWDPVFLTNGECAGASEAVEIAVRSEEHQTSDFNNLEANIVVRQLTPSE